ncbi:uncharacterized protein [Clytia hemisphaerica]|uniref:uncharacterized protein n=1 Tax=Clytia hemisphaerica TaxID=252671 RepID=UPI0034D5FB2C
MIVLAVIISQLIAEVFASTNVHVSGGASAHDQPSCGAITTPCFSVQYALDKSINGDTILLDINYEFVFKQNLQINKNVLITSYTSTTNLPTNQYATIIFPNPQFSSFGLINPACNFTAMNINFTVRCTNKVRYPVALFGVNRHYGTISMYNCLINLNLDFQNFLSIFQFGGFNWKFNFENTKFTAASSIYTVTSRMSGRSRRQFSDTNNVDELTFYNCSFNSIEIFQLEAFNVLSLNKSQAFDSYLSFDYGSEKRVVDCTFIQSDLDMIADNLYVTNCTFDGSYGSSGFFTPTYAQLSYKGKNLTIWNCSFMRATQGAVNTWKIAGLVTVLNTTFKDNKLNHFGLVENTLRSAALTVNSCYYKIINCIFQNNGDMLTRVESNDLHISLLDESSCSGVLSSHQLVANTTIYGDANYVNSQSRIAVWDFMYSKNFMIYCPPNHITTSANHFGTFEIFTCYRCDGASYNALSLAKIWYKNEWSSEFTGEVEKSTCYSPCPYQASCVGKIVSRGNYWGVTNLTGFVTFFPCPSAYCCSSLPYCNSYDTCAHNRTGRLCGACVKENVVSAIGENRCVNKEHCSGALFWIGYTLSSILIYLFAVYYKDVFMFIKTKLNKQRARITSRALVSVIEDEDSHPYQVLPAGPAVENDQPVTANNVDEKGFIKIAFFFYQTASVIRISASAKTTYKMPAIMDILTSFFNLKLDVQSSDTFDTCPLNTDNVIAINLLKTSVLFTSFGIVLVFILILSVSKKFSFCKRRESSPEKQEVTLLVKLKGAFIQLLLLGYASIATICLQAINCIEITGQLYLYVQATIPCYRSWQKVFFMVIGVWVVPFPFVIYIGCRLFQANQIDTNRLLSIFIFPPLVFWYLLKHLINRISTSSPESELVQGERNYILSILNGPFRYRDGELRIIWEPVLIIRRFLLIVCCTFIISPTEKLYPMAVLLLFFLMHDLVAQPFSQSFLNYMQYASMLLLCFLLVINQFWAFSTDVDITQNPTYHLMGKLFIILEMIILLLPIFILVVFLIVKICKIIFKMFTGKQD